MPLDLCTNTKCAFMRAKNFVLPCLVRGCTKLNKLSTHCRGEKSELNIRKSLVLLYSIVWEHKETMFFGRETSVFLQWSCACKVIDNGIYLPWLCCLLQFIDWCITWTGNSASWAGSYLKVFVYQPFFDRKGNLMTLCFRGSKLSLFLSDFHTK